MRIVLLILGVLILAVVALFGWRSYASQGMGVPEFSGALRPCPESPNCVLSTVPAASESFIEPLAGGDDSSWQALQKAIADTGGEIRNVDEDYLWATYTSSIFRFVDDVEMHRRPSENRIEVRSASRVGYSDLGANRKRVESIRQAFQGATGI